MQKNKAATNPTVAAASVNASCSFIEASNSIVVSND